MIGLGAGILSLEGYCNFHILTVSGIDIIYVFELVDQWPLQYILKRDKRRCLVEWHVDSHSLYAYGDHDDRYRHREEQGRLHLHLQLGRRRRQTNDYTDTKVVEAVSEAAANVAQATDNDDVEREKEESVQYDSEE